MKLTPLVTALVIATLPGIAVAQSSETTSTKRIDKRQELQQKRIDKGVESGKLNEKEAARLQKGQDRVQKAEDKAAADGTVTKKERAVIEHKQDVQSKRIYRQKHDAQTGK
jgi:hypothetical protein